jgi:hypothetical protein
MKYIKSYKLFESVGKIHFPTYTELHDFFIELEDDGITKFNYNNSAEALSKFIDGGYLFFPQKWDRTIQSDLYHEMSWKERNWYEEKPYDLFGDKWSDFFMDPVKNLNKGILRRNVEWLHLDDVEEKRTNLEKSGVTGKTFEELLVENIERGVVKAYPFIYMTFDIFLPEHLDEVIERLKMVYESTDFRPLYGFWKEDYVDENNGDVITFIHSNLYLVNCSDEEYKSLINIFNEHNLDKQVTNHFI